MKAKMTRRILALVLSVVMVLAIIPAAFASEFPDVKDDAWYAAAVDYCFDNSLMSGTGKGFEPNGKVTREMAVQTLYAMTGSPATVYEAKFKDVPDGKWYTNPIMWGAKNKIVNGYDNGKFGVGDFVTREQVAMFFYNYATFAGIDEDFASLAGFPDANKVSSWAKTAVQWAVAMGVLSGKSIDGKNYLKPQDPLTRAELASILARFHEKYIGDEVLCNHEETEIRNAKPATCTEDGYTGDTYCLNPDCHLKGEAIEKGKTIPALGHIDEDGDKFCDRCNEWMGGDNDDKIFTLTDSVVAGMDVVIYNAGNGKAVAAEMNGYYVAGMDVTPVDGTVSNPDAAIIWTVTANDNGTFTFKNGANELSADSSYNEAQGKTFNNLYVDAGHKNTWTLETCNADNNSFVVYNAEMSANYGHIYLEWYDAKTAFSAYDTSADRATEQNFGFQFYSFGKVCEHTWDEGKVVAPTCTEDGYMLYTCTKCEATKKDNIVPATGHVDANKDYICDVCNAELEAPSGDFILTDAIKDGDQVVIYNAGSGKAVAAEMNGYYVAGLDVTPVDGTVSNPDAAIIWTVTANDNGTFTFKNGANELSADSSYNEAQGKTFNNLYVVAGHKNTWTLETCNADNNSFVVYNAEMSANYGHIYLEWYDVKTAFSAYDTSAERATEQNFGFQFYVKGNPCEHDWVAGTPVAATCLDDGYTPYTCSKCNAAKKGDIVPATGHIDEDENGKCDVCGADLNNSFVLASEIKDGDQVVIYNAGSGKAVPAVVKSNYYLDAVDVTPAEDKIETEDASIIWKVTDNGDGSYTFTNGDSNILSINYNADTQKTSLSLDGANPKVTLESCNAENSSYYIYSATQTGKYDGGHVYLEWYAQYSDLSAYCTSPDRVSEPNFGFQFYVKGGEPIKPCEHDWVAGTPVAATCTEDGYTPYTCSKCQATKNDDVVPATGHNYGDDNVCDTCGHVKEDGFALTDALSDGMDVIIVNPGSKNAVKAAVKASYYVDLQAVEITDDQIVTEDASIIWHVTDNADGTYTFTSGNNILCVGVNGTHTNLLVNAADGTYNAWTLVPATSAKTFFVKSTIPANEKGDFYLEYNGSYSEFTIYGSTAPDEAAFGIQFYAKGGCEHDWVPGTPVSATCTEGAYTPYTCSKCTAGKKEMTSAALGHDWVADPENSVAPGCVTAGINAFKCSRCPATTTEAGDPATGHIDVAPADGICDVCTKDLTAAGYTAATSIAVGDKIIIVAEHESKYYATVGVLGATDTKVNNALSAREVKLDGNAIADASVDEAAIVWEVVAGSADGTYMLKASDGKYMAYTASDTKLQTAAAGTDFAITCGAGTATLMATADGMTDRGVSFRNNAGKPQFRVYKTSNKTGEYSWAITIYKLG